MSADRGLLREVLRLHDLLQGLEVENRPQLHGSPEIWDLLLDTYTSLFLAYVAATQSRQSNPFGALGTRLAFGDAFREAEAGARAGVSSPEMERFLRALKSELLLISPRPE